MVTRSKGRSPSRDKTKRLRKESSPSRQQPRRTPARSPSRRLVKAQTEPPATSTPLYSPRKKSPARKKNKQTIKVNKSRTLQLDSDSEPEQVLARGSRKLQAEVGPFSMDMKVTNISPERRRLRSHDLEKVVHVRDFAKKLGELSDEDAVEMIEKVSPTRQISEFGGWFGTLVWTIIAPIGIIGLYVFCNETSCSYTRLPYMGHLWNVSTYLHFLSFLGYIAFVCLVAILTALPFGGRKVQGLPCRQGRLNYITNGLFTFLCILLVYCVLEFKGVALTKFVVQHIFHLLISSIIVGTILSVAAYIRSFYVPKNCLNTQVLGKGIIYGFFMGREQSPRFLGILDLKFFVFRIALIGSILLDFIYFYQSLGNPHSLHELNTANASPSLTLLVAMHTVYFLDAFYWENAWLTTFEMRDEAFGYMAGLGHNIFPFMMVSMTKYLSDFGIQLAWWKLVLNATLFIIGLFLFRKSNNQKDAFRRNPYDPALSHLETIPTSLGKKLIVSSYWGFVRHPNYLGDIIVFISFASFAFTSPSALPLYCIVWLLIHRASRDNARCQQKYGTAWTRYCNRVRYILIPKIY